MSKISKQIDDENRNMIIALFFDSGTIEDAFYGGVVFDAILRGGELQSNSSKVIISLGDIFENSYQDINPYLIKDTFCTVDFSNQKKYTSFKDWPFCWIIEDIEYSTSIRLDSRLKNELSQSYRGMTNIDTKSTDTKKQFWKDLPRAFSVSCDTVTVFGLEEYGFGYSEICGNYSLRVVFDTQDEFEEYETEEIPVSRSSSFVKKHKDLEIVKGKKGIDRGILEMNFSLVKEVSIAGVFIWKSIEDIEKIYLPDSDKYPYITDHLFTSLYQASQGVERLQKIIIELINYRDKTPNAEHKKIEELLMSHNHISLNNWIVTHTNELKLPSSCNKLFILLKDFYNIARYSRFTGSSDQKFESTIFRRFGSECNKDRFLEEIKHLYGKQLGQVTNFYYQIIKDICSDLGIYAYEISILSPAYIVFMYSHPQHDLYESYHKINNAKKEALWWLVKNSDIAKRENALGEFASLDFDSAMISYYLEEILTNRCGSSELYETVDELYDELFQEDKEKAKDRLSIIESIIANPYVQYDYEENDEDEEDQEAEAINNEF